MSAGAVQLAAIGQQDAYLTGVPAVSYFTAVYRRHTPFSLQAFNIPFQGQQIQWGAQSVCRIPYKGDLVRGATLAVTLPALAPTSTDFSWPISINLQRPIPFLFVNGNLATALQVNIGVLDTYSISSALGPTGWLSTSPLDPFVSYSTTTSKFVFNCSSVTLNVADATTVGVFWGLDPHSFTSQPTSNTLQWDVSPGSPHGSSADFTWAQSGWIPTSVATSQNLTDSLVTNVASAVTLTSATPTSPGYFAQFVNLSLWPAPLGNTPIISFTPGGCFKFGAVGTYIIAVTLNVSEPVSRIGIGHWGQDGHPAGTWVAGTPGPGQWAWNDYVYSWLVMAMPLTPLAILPVTVTNINQYYYMDVETPGAIPLTIGDGTLGTEIQVTDVNQYWSLASNQTLVNKTVNLGLNWSQSGFFPQLTPLPASNAFTFLTTGIYNIRGTISTTGSNVFSVTLSNATVANVITWNTTQSRSPTINFTLPVHITSQTDQYRISMETDTPATLAPGATWFVVEQIGVPTGTTTQPNSFKKNGLLFLGNVLSTVGQSTTPLATQLNFSQTFSPRGTSRHVSVTPGGNIQFSNVGAYKFQAYFETANAYVTNLAIFQSTSDARPATPVYQVSSPLSIGTIGPYTIDVIAQCNDTSNVFFMDVTTVSPGGASNVTANAFVTVVGVTAPTPNTFEYVDSVGTYMIESAELRIGGQLIQTLTGEAIEIYNDLTVPQENQPGLKLLTGKLDTTQSTQDRTYYVNLPFFFYGNSELSVPVCSLARQDMEIYFKFRDFKSLILTSSQVTQQTIDASVIVEYAYLSNPEVNWMNSHVLDYIILQTQYKSYNLGESTVVDLEFQGPVREIAFVIQDSAAPPYSYVRDQGIGLSMTFNGEDFLDQGTSDFHFMNLIAPLERHTRQPDRVLYLVPFARRPQDPHPSGSINMSRINQKKFQVFLPGTTSLATKQLRVLASSYNILRVSDGLAGLMYE